MKILVYESITANYKNAQNSISEETYNDYKSLLKSGEDMRTQLILDLKKNPKIKILIGNHMAGEDQTSYLQRIKSKIDAAWVIAPESNGELMHCFSILKNKIWIGSSYEAIKITSSKKLTKEILKQSLIKFPKTLKPHQIHFKSDNYIVKPDDGAGSSETFKLKNITNINDLKFFYKNPKNLIIEEWIEGNPMSISLICNSGSAEIISINQQIIRINSFGKILYSGIKHLDLKKHAFIIDFFQNKIINNVLKFIPGLNGYVGIDFILTKNQSIYVIEINPRLTCSYIGLSNFLKQNIALKILECI